MVASGFSQNTGFLAAMQARTYSSCVGPHEVTTTASTASSRISSSPVACSLRTRDAVGHALRARRVDVGDRDHGAARQHLGQPADVVLPDHADADDPDLDCHLAFLLPIMPLAPQRSTRPRDSPQYLST